MFSARFCVTCKFCTNKMPGTDAPIRFNGTPLFCTNDLVRHTFADRVQGVPDIVHCQPARGSVAELRGWGVAISPCGASGALWVSFDRGELASMPDPTDAETDSERAEHGRYTYKPPRR